MIMFTIMPKDDDTYSESGNGGKFHALVLMALEVVKPLNPQNVSPLIEALN